MSKQSVITNIVLAVLAFIVTALYGLHLAEMVVDLYEANRVLGTIVFLGLGGLAGYYIPHFYEKWQQGKL